MVTGPVPKPKITVQKIPDKYCDLTCDGNITDAEPVTYSWIKNEDALPGTEQRITQQVFVNLYLTSVYQSVKFCILSSIQI